MGCCNSKSLKRVTNIDDGITLAIGLNKILVLHKDDIKSYSSDGLTLSISLAPGYTKEFKVGDLLNYDEVLDKLTKHMTGVK